MNALSWAAIAERLRAVGVAVPVTAVQGNGDRRARPVPPFHVDVPPAPAPADRPGPTAAIVAAAENADVTFWSVSSTANSSSRV